MKRPATADALHPNGKCSCAGEGRCEWCMRMNAAFEQEAMALDEQSEAVLDANGDADLMDAIACDDSDWSRDHMMSTASAVTLPSISAAPTEAVDVASAHDHEADSRESEPPPCSREFHVAQLDCVAFLRSLGDETVDLIVTDPAYESLEKHRAIGTTTRLTADWFEIFRNERFPELLAEMMRVLKRDAHLYIYSDQETAFVTKPMAESAGFKWWKHLTWRKVTSKIRPGDDEPAAHGGLGYHYRSASEWIGFYEKGKRKLADLGITDVLDGPRVRGYPTEKPVSVSRTLISQSCPPGGLVVDCFMGSGSTGEAAFLAGCRFAGCDVAERSIAITRARLGVLGGVEVGPPPGPVPTAQRSLF